MKKLFVLIILVKVLINPIISQSGINNYLEYSGSSSATDITGNEIFTISKIGGGLCPEIIVGRIPHATSLSIKHNSQIINNHNISCSMSTNIDPNSQQAITQDVYGNYYSSFKIPGPITTVILTRTYNGSTEVTLPSECFTDVFPLTSVPYSAQQYISATTNIQSNNASIIAQAQTLTAGCNTIQ